MSDSAERRIREFLAKYSPGIASELRAARARLRSMFPRGFELVYDNYNALVFGYSADDRASNVIVSIAGYPRWVTLFLLDGARLRDPAGLLVGAGKTVRSIRLQSAQQLSDPAVQALIAQAAKPHRDALASAKPLQTVVKSVSAKQRPRRPAASRTV